MKLIRIGGKYCGEEPTYVFAVDADFDECQLAGACSQQCRNTKGSFVCSCVEGYILKPDGSGCKALGEATSVVDKLIHICLAI